MTNKITDGRIDLSGFRLKFGGYKKILDEEIAKGLMAGALRVEERAKRSILQDAKTGRLYTRRSVSHQASAAGEAPANDTGRLAGSIHTELKSDGRTAYIKAGNAQVAYAAMLEFGTAHILPRPFMHPAFEVNKEWIRQRLEKAVKVASQRIKAL